MFVKFIEKFKDFYFRSSFRYITHDYPIGPCDIIFFSCFGSTISSFMVLKVFVEMGVLS